VAAYCSPVSENVSNRSFTGTLTGGTTITVSGASFSSADVGATIKDSKGGIPAGTTITAVNSATSVTISHSATGETSDTVTVSRDSIFLSVNGNGNVSGCIGPCVYAYNVSTALTTTTSPNFGFPSSGGASGIIIDNTATSAGASQIYFSFLSPATATRAVTARSTSGSTTVTSSAAFLATDVGRVITGPGIPASDTIASVASTSSITLAVAAGAGAGSGSFSITGISCPAGGGNSASTSSSCGVQASQAALQ
jgi:hypothetical protein